MLIYNGHSIDEVFYNTSTIGIYNSVQIWPSSPQPVDPFNPLHLPARTVRVRTSDGKVPASSYYTSATLVENTTDLYDVYNESTEFDYLLQGASNVLEVLGANTTGVTSMIRMFASCTKLTKVALFDTTSVTIAKLMFHSCNALVTLPDFIFTSVTDIESFCNYCSALTAIPNLTFNAITNCNRLFYYCSNAATGILSMYNKLSAITTITKHSKTFYKCGSNTTTGAAELAQIPSDWQ